MLASLLPLKTISRAVRDPAIVALPPTDNVLAPGIVTPPVIVAFPLTKIVPVKVISPSPLTLNTELELLF